MITRVYCKQEVDLNNTMEQVKSLMKEDMKVSLDVVGMTENDATEQMQHRQRISMLKDYEEVDEWFTEYLVSRFYDPNPREGKP